MRWPVIVRRMRADDSPMVDAAATRQRAQRATLGSLNADARSKQKTQLIGLNALREVVVKPAEST